MKRFAILLILCSCLAAAQQRTSATQEGNNTFTGANTFTGLSVGNGSVFTNTQMNNYFESLLNSASPDFHSIQAGYATEAVTGAIAVPSGATVQNANAIAGYIRNSSSTMFGGGVAGYFQSMCLVTGSNCWGSNQVVIDTASSNTSVQMFGAEVDTQPQNAPSAYTGMTGVGSFLYTPQSGLFTGSYAFKSDKGQTGYWDTSFYSANGGAYTALFAGATCLTGTCTSQPIQLTSMNSSSPVNSYIFALAGGDIKLNPATGNIVITGPTYTAKHVYSTSGSYTYTYPNYDITLAGLGHAQTFTAAQTFNTTISTNSQFTSTLADGTAPFVVTSNKPVANLTTVPATYDPAGNQLTNAHLVRGTCAIGSTCSVTLAGAAAFTSNATYDCWGRDATTPANAVTVAISSGSALAFTGTGTDTVNYICLGN